MTKIWKTILRTALLVIASLVIGINVYLWNAKSVMGNSLPMPFGYGMAVVLSGSMEPTISVDDLIIVRETADYAIGDVIVYQNGNMLVVHRIVEMGPDTVVTQGDANNAPDAPIRKEMIKGEVVSWIPGAGGFVRLLKTPAVSVGLLVAALLVSEMSFRKEKEQSEDELERLKEEIRRLKDEQE